jgi:fructokinase
MSDKSIKSNIVCFGEILWDVLPVGVMPGGAPMNVSYHLKKLSLEPTLITRVGHDRWGKELIQLMEKNEISTDYFQIDYELETGKVIANVIDSTNVTYDIIAPVAWDHIQWDPSFEQLVSDSDYFVFGSLVTRNQKSRHTLYQLLEQAKTKVLDINLRPPFFNREIIEELLKRADILKLNDQELEFITGWFSQFESEADRIRSLQDQFNIATIVVTKGNNGCTVVNDGSICRHNGFAVKVADTIGSGDAFLAAFLSKYSAGHSFPSSIEYANALGALVATYDGACPDYTQNEIFELINKNLTGANVAS